MLKRLLQTLSISKSGFWLIMSGSLTWSLTMIKSGIVYSYGMGFWGPNGHDGVWHIALAQGLARGSWDMPIFAGDTIRNYHIGFDLILTVLHKLTFIPIHTLYFQVLPPILSLLIGYFAYKFVYVWTKSYTQSFWAVFFVYFGGSWGWIVTLIRNGEIGGESLFWSQQSISTLVNPPFALSILFMFAGLYFLIKNIRTPQQNSYTTRNLLLVTFLFGSLVQIKVYAGVLILCGLFVAGIWRMLNRRGIQLMKVFTGSLIFSILIFSPLSESVGQTIIFRPFWFLESMVATPDRLYWPRMASAIANYNLAGNWPKLILAYGVTLFIFWLGNLGTRILKEPLFFKHLKNFRKLSYVEVFIYTIIGIGVLIPMFFIQSGTPWNTIQFMYYSLMFSGILAGVTLGAFLEKSNTNPPRVKNSLRIRIVVVAIVLLTIPTTYGTLKYHYLPSRPPAKISSKEIEALKFLSQQPDGIVLTLPFSKSLADKAINDPPRPLYLYESTAYVSAFSGKSTYLEDEVNLEITGYDWKFRRNETEAFFENPSLAFLSENQIKYVYISDYYKTLGLESIGMKKIFENKEIAIYGI